MILNVQRLKKKTVMIAIAAVIAIGTIGASTAVWAAQKTPEVKDAGDSILYHGVQYLKFSALTPDDQKFVIQEGLGAAVYVLEGYEHPVFSDELTHEEQARVTIEEGYFSPASIARLKEFREKFPRGVSVTITHQEDPSIPPGTSLTIRSLTPEESAVFKKREEEAKSGGSSNDQK